MNTARTSLLMCSWCLLLAGYANADTTTNSIGMKFVLVPAGEFMMGSPENEPGRDKDELQHRVKITKPFYMGQYEVTVGQYSEFTRSDAYKNELGKTVAGGWGYNGKEESDFPFDYRKEYSFLNWGFPGQTNEHPVVNVSWNEAVAFCKWLTTKENKIYRLPTEAEWEYACRAGTTTRFQHGDDEAGLQQTANIADESMKDTWPKCYKISDWNDGYAFTAPVGKFKPNRFGLFDMLGNVWEWCSDRYEPNYYGESTEEEDPQGPGPDSPPFFVVRGGGWAENPIHCRSADRLSGVPHLGSHYRGFRVVREQ